VNEATDFDEQLPDAADTMRSHRPVDELHDRTIGDDDQTQQVPMPQFG